MPISIKKLLLSLSNQWKSRRSIDSFLQIATRALLVTALFNSQFVSFPILVTVQGFQKHAKSFSLTLFVLANYHLDFTVSNIYQRPHSTNFQVVFTLKTTFSYSQLSCMAPRTERLISFLKYFHDLLIRLVYFAFAIAVIEYCHVRHLLWSGLKSPARPIIST